MSWASRVTSYLCYSKAPRELNVHQSHRQITQRSAARYTGRITGCLELCRRSCLHASREVTIAIALLMTSRSYPHTYTLPILIHPTPHPASSHLSTLQTPSPARPLHPSIPTPRNNASSTTPTPQSHPSTPTPPPSPSPPPPTKSST